MAGDGGVAVLVVDDRREDLLAIASVLEGEDVTLITAGNGAEALRRVLERDFAVILLDVMLPDIQGFEVASIIKQRERSRHTPIIFLTAAGSDPGLSHRGYSVGAVDYLSKPLDADILRAKVSTFVELFRKDRRIAEQAAALRAADRRERELEIAELRLANERRLRDAAREAVHARDEFLSIASHELRTPIMTLQLRLDSLARALDQPGAEVARREMVSSALRQSTRLLGLVDKMLDVSRIANGRLTLQRERFDLVEAVREIADRFHETASRAGCTLEIDAAGPVVGVWDRLRVEQILSNLVGNAIAYAPRAPVEITARSDGGAARISVKDHGDGIAPEDIERVFGQFERAVSPRHYGGLGMGLFIAQQIAVAHGGVIKVESAAGAGATFTVELPHVVPGVGLEPTLP